MIDFPASPIIGQQATLANGVTYQWNGTIWVAVGEAPYLGFRRLGRIVTTAGQATIDFANIPSDINDLKLHFALVPQTTGAAFLVRFFDAAGVIVTTRYFAGNIMTYHTSPNGSASAIGQSNLSGFCLNYYLGGWLVHNNAAFGIRGSANIHHIREPAHVKGIDWQCSYFTDGGAYYAFVSGSGFNDTARSITGVRLLFDVGTMAAGGAVTLWGSP
jgi:hypothetical protein